MYTAWMVKPTPNVPLYNFGRQNADTHNLYLDKGICRAGVLHALDWTSGGISARGHSLRILAAIVSMSAIMLTGCIEQGKTVPLMIVRAEPPPASAEVPQAPVPRAKPKPPASTATTAGVPAGRKPMPDAAAQFRPPAFAPEPDVSSERRDAPEGSEANGGSVVMVPPAAPLPEPLPAPVEALPSPATPATPEPLAAVPPSDHPGPKALVGLDEQATVRLLGEPSWTEDVPPAKYWQYATPSCVLRVFFFMEMTTQNFRALSYELTSSDDAPNVHERCFAQLLAQASGRQTAHGNRIN